MGKIQDFRGWRYDDADEHKPLNMAFRLHRGEEGERADFGFGEVVTTRMTMTEKFARSIVDGTNEEWDDNDRAIIEKALALKPTPKVF